MTSSATFAVSCEQTLHTAARDLPCKFGRTSSHLLRDYFFSFRVCWRQLVFAFNFDGQTFFADSLLLQLGVLRRGLLQDRDVRVGVFPEREEILVGCSRAGNVTAATEARAKPTCASAPIGAFHTSPR